MKRGLAESREKARAVIMAGRVAVEGRPVDKPGRAVATDAAVDVEQGPAYVSRGGLKLAAAMERFAIRVEGLNILDVGASTGGFTDCLLQRGARRVVALDVGYGQLAWKLRQDPRVKVVERTNIRHVAPGTFPGPLHGAVADVSFISLKLVLPPVSRLLEEKAFIVALIKPQFEVGKGSVGKGGVVRDPRLHQAVVEDICIHSKSLGWKVEGHMPSPILGPKGNREFLLYLKR